MRSNKISVTQQRVDDRFLEFIQSTKTPETIGSVAQRFKNKQEQKIKRKLKDMQQRSKNPLRPLKATGPVIELGIDAEWVFNHQTKENEILSYQGYLISGKKSLSFIVYTKGPKKSQRLSFEKFIALIIQTALEKGGINEWPHRVNVYAHFLRSDLAAFSDFWKFKDKVSGVRGTVTSLKDTYALDYEKLASKRCNKSEITLRDKHHKPRNTAVKFIDTLLLTPSGLGLESVGELLGLPKLTLPNGHSKSRMDIFLAEEPEAFEAYAIRDAEIAVLYGLRATHFAKNELGLKGLPPTIGSSAVKVFMKDMSQDDYHLNYGLVTSTKTFWSKTKQHVLTRNTVEPGPSRLLFENFFTSCYLGGWNECFEVGPSHIDKWNDIDLAGAYTTGLVDLNSLDYDMAFLSQDIQDFCGHVCGAARVKFKWPESVRFPSLPVKSGQYGLIFPLEGEAYITAPEIEVAAHLGCEIEILQGAIVPWIKDSESLFAPVVRLVKRKRASFPKGSFEEKMWKETGNSLYGKHGQGLKDKNAFDTVTGLSKKIPYSPLSNPYMASHTTGFIRAVIAELLNGIPEHRTVISVTTDGFLTNALESEMDTSGTMCQRFQSHCSLVDQEVSNVSS